MHFEKQGLFLGLISYPFFIDGKELFNKELKQIFITHKENQRKYSHESEHENEQLYTPVAYRMFGSHGLAILSLIDDYTFCNQIFNSNHIELSEDATKDEYNMKNEYQSVVITGTSETDDDSTSLLKKARDTFLREKNKYPFIGIIRLKIDYRLLINRGYQIIRAIRKWIMQEVCHDSVIYRYISIKNVKLECLIVDGFDNDELVVLAFSEKMGILYEFLDRIRRLNCKDAGINYNKNVSEKHIFASCHLSFGYHIEYDISKKSNNSMFMEIYDERDTSNHGIGQESKKKDEDSLVINCLCETKPGHRNYFCNYIKRTFNDEVVIRRTVTGGTIANIELPISLIHKIERLCRIKEEGFQKHLRRIKITLNDHRRIKSDSFDTQHEEQFEATSIIEEEYISQIENLIKRIGISKIVRNKLLSLFRLYNDCCNNRLQSLYFEELNPVLKRILYILKNWINDEIDIRKIEEILNEEIASLEEAFYNRIHNSKTPNTTLEYSGGIQQHLTAFNYAYKQLVGLMSPLDSSVVYTRITSAERVSSMRTHLDLNINHIIYPELFATTVWKEASNFASYILHKVRRNNDQNSILINTWNSFIENSDNLKKIQYVLFQQIEFHNDDPVFRVVKDILNDNQTLKYFVNDYIVYHMAFQRDYKMMWHFYLKTMLQTTNCYHRLGKIKRAHVIYMLFRLMMIALRETGEGQKQIFDFIKKQKNTPYDYLLAEIWCDSFSKIRKASEIVFTTLNDYGFRGVSELIVYLSEIHIAKSKINQQTIIKTPYLHEVLRNQARNTLPKGLNEACIEARRELINNMLEGFSRYELLEPSEQHVYNEQISPDFIVCLLFAYLKRIYTLDGMEDSEPILKSVPYNDRGDIDSIVLSDIDKCPKAINILADPTSGFLITSQDVRNSYFALRTTFYRSLWNYRMKGSKKL